MSPLLMIIGVSLLLIAIAGYVIKPPRTAEDEKTYEPISISQYPKKVQPPEGIERALEVFIFGWIILDIWRWIRIGNVYPIFTVFSLAIAMIMSPIYLPIKRGYVAIEDGKFVAQGGIISIEIPLGQIANLKLAVISYTSYGHANSVKYVIFKMVNGQYRKVRFSYTLPGEELLAFLKTINPNLIEKKKIDYITIQI